VIGYIRTGKFRMDVRTLDDDELPELADALGRATWPTSAVPRSGTASAED
jgi:hypothetical protein